MRNFTPGGAAGVRRDISAWFSGDVHVLAFRLAAAFLLTNVFLGLVAWALTGSISVMPLLLDAVLAVGLLDLRPGARSVTLVRAYAGAVLGPILIYLQEGAQPAAVSALVQIGYSGAFILVLQGEVKRWKLITAVGVCTVYLLANMLGFARMILFAEKTPW